MYVIVTAYISFHVLGFRPSGSLIYDVKGILSTGLNYARHVRVCCLPSLKKDYFHRSLKYLLRNYQYNKSIQDTADLLRGNGCSADIVAGM